MGIDEQLVQNAESTVRLHEKAEKKTFYLSYNRGDDTHGDVRHTEPHIIAVKLPENATNIRLHGPGEFKKRGKGMIYGVQVTFTEETKGKEPKEHFRIFELPHPVKQVQILDREPDEQYKAVA